MDPSSFADVVYDLDGSVNVAHDVADNVEVWWTTFTKTKIKSEKNTTTRIWGNQTKILNFGFFPTFLTFVWISCIFLATNKRWRRYINNLFGSDNLKSS